jgi:diguanylate cyclase (GGDEF)-like protein
MRRPVAWVGRALAALGLAVVVAAALHAWRWALVAGAGGFAAATGLALAPLVRGWLAQQPATRPVDLAHVVDLLRRAHGGRAAWLVGLPQGDLELVDDADGRRAAAEGEGEGEGDRGAGRLAGRVRRRGAALTQLASIDGRAHVAREPEGSYVAAGDFPFGAGVLLASPDASPAEADRLIEDLRRVVAGMRLAETPAPGEPGQFVAKQLAAIAGGAQTLEGVAKAGVELAQRLTQRGTAIVLQATPPAETLQVVAVSRQADNRLLSFQVPAGAPAGRAVSSAMPVVSRGDEDVFGAALHDRRRRDRAGMAYPLLDGRVAIGALVLIGPPSPPDGPLAEQVQRLTQELGARLAGARALHEAEQRAVVDALTGLRNRRELERQLSQHGRLAGPPPGTLVYFDLDHFKTLNDTLGHAAGDGALRHVAGILQAAIRDKDLAARIGGEEFAVWMPHTPLAEGVEVADRIRRAIATTAWHWNGTRHPLTASGGVAAFPDTVRDLANLRGAADAALYRAKQAGRNRVEKAPASG